MSSVKRTPEYRKQSLYDVIDKIKQLEIPIYFSTFFCADVNCEELLYITYKLNNLGLSIEGLKKLCYQELCNLLNNNPILVQSIISI